MYPICNISINFLIILNNRFQIFELFHLMYNLIIQFYFQITTPLTSHQNYNVDIPFYSYSSRNLLTSISSSIIQVDVQGRKCLAVYGLKNCWPLPLEENMGLIFPVTLATDKVVICLNFFPCTNSMLKEWIKLKWNVLTCSPHPIVG